MTTAQRECAMCRGREHGECSHDCRWSSLTATAAEQRAELARIESELRGDVAPRSGRGWLGPISHNQEEDAA